MVKYHWKSLGLISPITLSNIITFIQFSLVPLNSVKSESSSSQSNVKDFISLNFGNAAKVFLVPLNLIDNFNKIAAPLRVGLFSTLVFSIITFLYIILFMNSWHILLFLADIFFPAMFFCGIMFIAKDYEEGRSTGIALLIVGLIYFILRILRFLWPYFDRRGWKWYKKCADTITAIFLNRLTQDIDCKDLDAFTAEVRHQTKKRDQMIAFELNGFPLKKRIIDISLSGVLFLTSVILYCIGWRKILQKKFSGDNLEDLVLIVNIINIILMAGFVIRLIVNITWFFPRFFFPLYKKLKDLAYLGFMFLAGVSLMPILQMVLQSSAVSSMKCEWFYYYDFRSNANSFLQYFTEKPGEHCVQCTKQSANMPESRCSEICYYDNNTYPLEYKVLTDSQFISESELTSVYLIPVVILEIFYLAVFLQLLRQIYITQFDVIKVLPGPTKNPECKFHSIIGYIRSSGLNQFRHYRLNNNLYYFSFTQSRLFVLFFVSLLPIVPIQQLQPYANKILPWIFFIASIIISTTSMFMSPYISVLNNYINGISYAVGAVTSALVGLHVSEIIEVTPMVGNAILVVIIATPIVTALVIPFFATRDMTLRSVGKGDDNFSIEKIMKMDKTLHRLINYRKEAKENHEKIPSDLEDFSNDSVTDEIKPMFSDDEDDPEKSNPKFVDFNLLKVAPIIVQEALMKKNDEKVELMKTAAHELWHRQTIHKLDFQKASAELKESAEYLFNTIAHNGLYKLLNLSVIVSSCCFGWTFSSGIVQWQHTLGQEVEEYYIRCNMNPTTMTYPAYGTY